MTADARDFGALLPALLAGLGALGILGFDGIRSGRSGGVRPARMGAAAALLGVGALVSIALLAGHAFRAGAVRTFDPASGRFVLDPFGAFVTAAIALASAAVVISAPQYIQKRHLPPAGTTALLLLSISGLFVWVGARDLVLALVAMELATLPLVFLVASEPARTAPNESGLKAVVHAGVASGLSWFGLALLFGATGATAYAEVGAAVAGAGWIGGVGLGLLVAGWLARLAAVPFQLGSPDVQREAPVPAAAFLSSVVPIAGFAALLRLTLSGPFLAGAYGDALWAIAATTLVVGHALAALQTRLKPMMAFTAMAQAGWFLAALAADTGVAASALLFGVVAAAWMNLGVFAVLVTLAGRDSLHDAIADFAGFAGERPLLAGLLALFCLSQAAVPGTIGFVARFRLLHALVDAGEVGLALVGVLASLLSFYAFARIPLQMVAGEARPRSLPPVRSGEGIALAVCAAVVVLGGVAPAGLAFGGLEDLGLWHWVQQAVEALRQRAAG